MTIKELKEQIIALKLDDDSEICINGDREVEIQLTRNQFGLNIDSGKLGINRILDDICSEIRDAQRAIDSARDLIDELI